MEMQVYVLIMYELKIFNRKNNIYAILPRENPAGVESEKSEGVRIRNLARIGNAIKQDNSGGNPSISINDPAALMIEQFEGRGTGPVKFPLGRIDNRILDIFYCKGSRFGLDIPTVRVELHQNWKNSPECIWADIYDIRKPKSPFAFIGTSVHNMRIDPDMEQTLASMLKK